MLEKYAAFRLNQETNPLPFTLRSKDKNGVISASVQTFLPGIPYSIFARQLSRIEEWCEFVPLHLNIKTCSFQKHGEEQKLGFYVGAKGYRTPDQASLLLMKFHATMEEEVLLIHFSAKDGPYDSSDYDFSIRAIGIEGGVYLEFDLSSVPGKVSSLANIYFLTVARNKMGFSKIETVTGETKYIGGRRGAAERNVVRYLLAIQTYFATLEVSPKMRYEARLERWFDATQQYKRQLYEMDRETYLSIKKRERKNQIILMEARKHNVAPVYQPEIRTSR